jgi:hypothetical protein
VAPALLDGILRGFEGRVARVDRQIAAGAEHFIFGREVLLGKLAEN